MRSLLGVDLHNDGPQVTRRIPIPAPQPRGGCCHHARLRFRKQPAVLPSGTTLQTHTADDLRRADADRVEREASPLADGDREIPSVGQVGSFSSDHRRLLRPHNAPNVGELLGAHGEVGGVGASR